MFEEDNIIEHDYEGATKLSVADYARYRKTTPQLIHYYLRNGILKRENCVCGRSVLDVRESDEILEARQKEKGSKIL